MAVEYGRILWTAERIGDLRRHPGGTRTLETLSIFEDTRTTFHSQLMVAA